MSTAPHRIRYQGGDKVVHHVPRDRYGRAAIIANATYSIVRLWRSEEVDDRAVQASASATVDSTATTLNGEAGPAEADPRLLPVTNSAGFTAGREYLLAQGEHAQVVVCERIDTSQVLCRSELRRAYTTGATLSGIEIAGTFPSAAAANEEDLRAGGGPFGVLWSYTIAGTAYFPLEEAWLTRYTTAPLITVPYLELHWPEVSSMTGSRWSPEDLIAAATDEILADIETAGRDPHGLQHSRVLQLATVELCIEKVHRQTKTENANEIADEYRQRYDRRMRDLLTGRTPTRTAEVQQSTNTATQGGSKAYGTPIIRRS